MTEEGQKETIEGGEGLFGQEKPKILCTFNECGKGHQWVPTVVLAKCPSCQAPGLMVKMENCPYCNEPVEKMTFRSDHVPPGAGVAPRCIGAKVYGETMDIVLERKHWEKGEEDAESKVKVKES
jgi:hypothetical protein